ncbi:hypothetical protein DCAR_0933409 [Daucus carota subsp. sativus]|uniref:Uncharacterized protein n=1 Tax=Daucus carota subsp. sativus TaxID=79200 RepID=A0A175YCW6_DAUCS|nr:hypothetical protein DCAR_0933409 [Daucus carota subsp. sativus]
MHQSYPYFRINLYPSSLYGGSLSRNAGKSAVLSDDEGQNEYENEGFIVDDENKELVVTVMRKCKRKGGGIKAHRDHHSGLSGGNEFDRSGRDLFQHSLFGDDEVVATELEHIAGEEQLEEDNELGDEDDLGNFIAEEDLDKHGAPMR